MPTPGVVTRCADSPRRVALAGAAAPPGSAQGLFLVVSAARDDLTARKHEQRTGEADENWPDWYAEFLASEQAGTEPPK